MRKIETGFDKDDQIVKAVLESVLGQLSDGIWENSRSMNKYWLSLEIQENNIMVSESFSEKFCGTFYPNPFLSWDEGAIKTWFADKLKRVVKTEEKDSGCKDWWKRDNDKIVLDYLSRSYKDEEGVYHPTDVTVADAYKIYDRLKGRTGRKKKVKA